MNTRTLLLLSLAVISLGCTSNNSPSATAGADITEFAFDTTSATDKDMVELTLKIENVGAKTIDGNSKAWIYNAPFGEGAWRLESINGDKSNKAIIGDGDIIPTKGFFPFDAETGTSGTIITKDMFFTLPGTPIGMKENYEFTARLCYPYRTTSSTSLAAVSPTEFRAKPDTSKAGTLNSAGPLRVELKSDSIIRSGGRIPLPFIITDVGGGYATSRKAEADCTDEVADTPSFLRNRAKLTVLADGEATDCKDTEIALDASGKAVVWCNIASSGENPKQESHMTATLTYNYFATKSAKIEVKGVLGGVEPGAAAGGGVVAATLVRDICEKAGQYRITGGTAGAYTYSDRAIPVCVEKDSDVPESFDYPGTKVSVLAQPQACKSKEDFNPEDTDCKNDNPVNRAKYLKDALGSRYEKATIRTLNTHDLTAKDLKIGDLTLADLDSWFISSQYTKSMLTDKDYWLEKDESGNYKPYVKPLGIGDTLCSSAICTSASVTLVKKTDPLKEKKTVATHKISSKKLSDVSSINGMEPAKFLDQPIYGLKITSIYINSGNGATISEITKNTAKISEINIEDLYLAYLIKEDDLSYEAKIGDKQLSDGAGVIPSTLKAEGQHTSKDTSLLDHIKCDSSTTYTQNTHAFCVTSVGVYNGQKTPLPKFSGTSSTQCTQKCKSLGTVYLGACNIASKTTTDSYECKGRSIIAYGLKSPNKYDCQDECLCYKTVQSDLSSAETMLLCQK